jgi:starch synthase
MLFYPGNEEDDLAGKKRCKEDLLARLVPGAEFPGIRCFGSVEDSAVNPLFTFIGRLNEQKGIDLLLAVLDILMERHPQVQMIIFGTGANEINTDIIRLTELEGLRGRVCFLQGFNPHMANRVFAAGDFFILPSRYEPCGLTDFIAQLFGNIPIVHHVGGLVKVIDGVTGIAYEENSPEDLLQALERALVLYQHEELKRTVQLQAVKEIEQKFTWPKVMRKYLELYQKARVQQLCRE